MFWRVQVLWILFVVSCISSTLAFEWGNIFFLPLAGTNLITECTYEGYKICCEASDSRLGYYPRKTSSQLAIPDFKIRHFLSVYRQCKTSIEYIPSKYEIAHLSFAKNLTLIADEKQRLATLLRFIWDDIPHSIKWLRRIALRSRQRNGTVEETEDDRQYLSRFRYHVVCPANHSHTSSINWIEWIEPLVLQTRHPMGMTLCPPGKKVIEMVDSSTLKWIATGEIVKIDPIDLTVVNTDYVLVANAREVQLRHAFQLHAQRQSFNHSSNNHDRHNALASHSNAQQQQIPPTAYFFDAGASRFDSSSSWFICSYAQQHVAFDRMFGWELTLLEPKAYWKKVPSDITPLYSFYNHPVSCDEQDPQSLIGQVKKLTSKADFVSVKLDIDAHTIELPIAMQVLRDHTLHELIDEFFFEFHFRDEIMLKCGFGDQIPHTFEGLNLNRYEVTNYFQQLRYKGIRSHSWP